MSDTMINTLPVRDLMEGMGQAVAERTVLRKDKDGVFETWGDVASRVALGNSLLVKPGAIHSQESERAVMEAAIAKATLLMSGRHLQHGDADQPNRNIEVFSNCATSAASFLTFMLLLNGAGVGRCYDDDMIITNWDNAPNLRCVLSTSHADFDWSQDEDVRDARHKYDGVNVVWHEVADTREGWSKAIEVWEGMAYQKIHRDSTLVLDFSKVRPRGAPIMGMQGRPSSGPKPLMNALIKCSTIKGAGMAPWKQAMYVDHYLAECVLVGGARRAARMSTKSWRDPGVLEFIRVKRPVEYLGMSVEEVIAFRADRVAKKLPTLFPFLWSSNNSVTVDDAFWLSVRLARDPFNPKPLTRLQKHAARVLTALSEAAYGDGTGEPGIINVDMLRQNHDGMTDMSDGQYVGSKKYQIEDETRLMLSRLAKISQSKPHAMITNPCGEISLSVLGAYCVIADVVPYHADTLAEAEESFRIATRALIRTNTMDNLYARETARTNRIGVGITGIHEFAWKFFKVGFRDLVKPDFSAYHECYEGVHGEAVAAIDFSGGVRAAAFWLTMARFSRAVQDEAISYSKELGVNAPHTALTIKPAGTTSKLFGLTEGWHLPAMAQYLRWVQFRFDDPLVETYKALGYPTRELKTYSGTIIVGFPTQPVIGGLGMGDHLVTATEATITEQYEWMRLGERFWIKGTDENGEALHADGEDVGNQISYTGKFDPVVVTLEMFVDMLIDEQSTVRVFSFMPVEVGGAYEYLPEQSISKSDYEEMMRAINNASVSEDIGKEHVDCENGACPIDFKQGSKS